MTKARIVGLYKKKNVKNAYFKNSINIFVVLKHCFLREIQVEEKYYIDTNYHN